MLSQLGAELKASSVWSQHLLDRIEDEAAWLLCPGVADVLVGLEAFQDLETASEVVDRNEIGQLRSELVVILVGIAIDRRFLDGAVHPLGLTIRSGGGSVWLDGARCHWLGRPGQSDGPGTGGPAIAIFGSQQSGYHYRSALCAADTARRRSVLSGSAR